MAEFKTTASYRPTGDQPTAVVTLAEGLEAGDRMQTLVGATGTGKTATVAWTMKTVTLLETAASDPAVDRIFVNPAIKRMLCEGPARGAPWAARLRPWWGHHDHFHVRLKCPAGSPACVAQEAPPDDGCGPSLAWWFSSDAQATLAKRKHGPEAGPEVPEACSALLAPPANVAAK